jgi:hypothetical protein
MNDKDVSTTSITLLITYYPYRFVNLKDLT